MTCIKISQEAGQVVWYSHLFQNFPQFNVIHTVKGFGIVKDDPEGGEGREEGGGFRMGNTGIPVVDSFRYLAKLIQYCKV